LVADSDSSSSSSSSGSTKADHSTPHDVLPVAPTHQGTSLAGSATVSVAATSSAVSPQQFLDSWGFLRNSGINPVFFEPTYDPCTACGPGCWTDSPGSTSPEQCGKLARGAVELWVSCRRFF
jgi:hypothetical protein